MATTKPIEQTAQTPSPAPSPPSSQKAIVASITWGRERKRSPRQYASDMEAASVTMLVPEGVTVAKAIEEAKGLVDFMLGPEPEPDHPAPPPRQEPPPQSRGPPPASRGGYGGGYSQPAYGGAPSGRGGPPRPKLCRDGCNTEIVWDNQNRVFVNAYDTEAFGREGEPHRCRSQRR